MFVLRHTLRRSLGQFGLRPGTLVISSRWSSADAGKPADSEKEVDDEGQEFSKQKQEHPNQQYQRNLQQQDELFEEFTKSTADLALVEKQDKFLGESNAGCMRTLI